VAQTNSQPGIRGDAPEQLLFEGYQALLPSFSDLLITVLTLGLALLYYYPRARTTHYRITNERVVVDRGLFSKRLDQVDLYRIQDYAVERPLMQRIMSTGNIVLYTHDRTTPALALRGLSTDVVELYEALRRATEQQKRRRGVRVLDGDPHAL
jgi:uncharacterized membrane protein YdbT with pleckstrin-like domain